MTQLFEMNSLEGGQKTALRGSKNPIMVYAGQYYDQETGLHYNYHRYYDPKYGRYLRADPIGLLGGINLYAYVQNNPLNHIDPYGLHDWGSEIGSNVVTGITTVATVAAENAGLIGSGAALGITGATAPLGDLVFPTGLASGKFDKPDDDQELIDEDGDGIPQYMDMDDNGDGVPDFLQGERGPGCNP